MSDFDFDLEPRVGEDLSYRQERCSKAIKTVIKAIIMRLFICGLLIWIVLRATMDLWVIGLMLLVMGINMTGFLPLTAELRKRRAEWRLLLAEENNETP